MKLCLRAGSTSQMVYAFVQDTRYGDGRGLTGLAYNTSGLSGYYWRPGATTATAITLQTSTLGTYTSGSFKELDATNMPGVYEVGIPDAALATGASHCILQFKGAANMAPVMLEIELAGIKTEFQKNLAFSNFMFPMHDDQGNLKSGLTITSTRSVDGAAFASTTNTASEIGSTGIYKLNLSAADLNGDMVCLKLDGGESAKVLTISIPTVK